MNSLGLTLVHVAAQVTLVALAAIGLYLLAARRGPKAGSFAARLGLGGIVALTLLQDHGLRAPPCFEGPSGETGRYLLLSSRCSNSGYGNRGKPQAFAEPKENGPATVRLG